MVGYNGLIDAYPVLFATIDTTFSAGDGATKFTLPDMRGKVSVAAGAGAGLTNRVFGSIGGEENHTLTVNEIPSHTHTYLKQDGIPNIVAPASIGITASDDSITTVNSDGT